jgi:hypothetical protein
MKKFIVYVLVTFFAYFFLLEITTRVFDLSAHTMPAFNLNNNKLFRPGAEGIQVQGGMREIASHYKINQQGFNSLKDYTALDENKISIAIIGDSYIQGIHVDVENSIGRILEAETLNKVEVHEYGIDGMNIVDFGLIFTQSIKNRYDYTFIVATDKDIAHTEASAMGNANKIPNNSIIREIYNRSSLLRYLNMNHKLSVKIKKIFSFFENSNKQQKKITAIDVNVQALEQFDSTCTFLYEKGKLDTSMILPFKLPTVEVKPTYTPFNHGFDSHWNLNGRKNCALAIKNYIEETK